MKECKKILYAEDEEDIRTIAKLSLEDIGGYTLKICMNGLEVIQTIKEFEPDLVLLDVMMPEMDGPTTLREIRKINQFEKTPIIFMTARAQGSEIEEYIKMGAVGVIVKPFDPIKLGNEIKKIWDKFNER